MKKLEGVESVSVNLLTETMEVDYHQGQLDSGGIVAAVGGAGESHGNSQAPLHGPGLLLRLPPQGFPALSFPGTLPVSPVLPIVYVNRKFFAVGFKTLGHLAPNMDSLIALGASAAIAYGIFALYRIGFGLGHGDMEVVMNYSHDLYFESAGMILTLITVGKYLESRSKGKTSEAITKLMDLSPKTAVLLVEGQEVEVPTEELREGDVFLVKPGSLIPVDFDLHTQWAAAEAAGSAQRPRHSPRPEGISAQIPEWAAPATGCTCDTWRHT